MTMSEQNSPVRVNRRTFLEKSSLAGVAASFPSVITGRAQASLPIKVGLVGCGGRGTGAALNVLQAETNVIYPPPRNGYHTENAKPGARILASNVTVVALADLFADRLAACREQLRSVGNEVPDNHCFVGFDSCQKLLAVPEVNYVILASPPQFRPRELRAAVEAGKHVFAEKPAAVDAPGVRSIMESGEIAARKGLAVGAGTVTRYSADAAETVRRIRDGAIGRIELARAYFNIGEIWMIPRESGWGDMEWQIRNWPYFTWLSGDILVEQHIHRVDHINWIMGGPPIRAYGMGGRLARPSTEYGHIYDHFAVEYEYPDGTLFFSQNRQIEGCTNRNSAIVRGEKGTSNCSNLIQAESEWRYQGAVRDPYEQTHINIIESIRSGNPINETKALAEATLTAIMGRESAYSGQEVTWEATLKSTRDYTPERYHLGEAPFPPVPKPSNYRFY